MAEEKKNPFLCFRVEGHMIQEFEIVDDFYTPKSIVHGLATGELYTTTGVKGPNDGSPDRNICKNVGGSVVIVARIISQRIDHDTRYTEFQLIRG